MKLPRFGLFQMVPLLLLPVRTLGFVSTATSCSTAIRVSHDTPHRLGRAFLSMPNNDPRPQRDGGDNKYNRPRRPRGSNRARSSSPQPKAVLINKEIIQLGKEYKWRAILLLHKKEKGYFNHINYATAINRLARIRRTDASDPLFQDLLATMYEKIARMGVKEWLGIRAFANIVHGIAKMGVSNENVMLTLKLADQNAKWLVENGNAQQIANSIWAFAKLGVESPLLFLQVEQRAEWLVDNGNAQSIANTVWAFAKLGVESPALFSHVEQRAKWLVENGNAQSIANTVWAFAKLGVESPLLFTHVEQRAEWLAENGNAQNIANTVWAFAKLGVESPLLFSQVEQRAEWLVENGNTQDIANTVWAFAKLGVESPALFSHVNDRAEWLVENGNTQDIANTVWAFAKLGVELPALFLQVDHRAASS